jgi:hypothetical protein
MTWLCRLRHSWVPRAWSSRLCKRCGIEEILIYHADIGAVWERVDEAS